MESILFLADFSVIRPEPGLMVWTLVIFAIFWFLMAKFAFKPIQQALKTREQDIQDALDQAKKAREEIEGVQAKNEQILMEAREERSKILKEAKDAKDAIISEAKEQAKAEAEKIVERAKQDIENQRMASIIDMKNQIGNFALEIAQKILQKEMEGDKNHEAFVKSQIENIKLN